MNRYTALKDRQQKELNAFPLGAAFGNQQFAEMMYEMMYKWELTETDTDKIYSIGSGCYLRRSDSQAFHEMLERFDREIAAEIAGDPTGDGFIRDMFYAELANHEYCITYDLTDTLYALGLTLEQINADKRLVRGLQKAEKQYLKDSKARL
jgi:hypothetical protein